MVGRSVELAELVRAWARVPAGAPRTVVITGSAGVGKTLLVSSAVEAVRETAGLVLSGTARVHAPAPYDWLAAVLSGRNLTDLPVPADALAWLAQHPDAPGERYTPGALLRLAVQTVRSLVGAGPGLLVVEDLHALDPASLNLVGELATAQDLPVLLLVTSQPPDSALSPALAARTLARLSGAPGSIRQHLHPLSPVEVGEILAQVYPGRRVPAATVDAVWRTTNGIPYWIMELVAAAAGKGPEGLAEAPLPRHLHVAEPAHEELTARETEVLACLAQGLSNKQVARLLGISIRTVTVHVSNLLRKTRSSSRTEAALWAVQHRRIPTSRPA
jgi:DNA-binding CsgD family transcriptional regulator/predicted ATPase